MKRRLSAPKASTDSSLPKTAVVLPVIDERLVRRHFQPHRVLSTRHLCSELLPLVIMIEEQQQGRFRAEETAILVGQQHHPQLTELTL